MTGPLAPARHLRLGGLAAFALLPGVLGVGSLLTIDGAIIAHGRLEPGLPTQTVSHVAGGKVASVPVREGQAVLAGMPLVMLDTDELDAELEDLITARAELAITEIRLRSEQQGLQEMKLPAALLALTTGNPALEEYARAEARLFQDRRAGRTERESALARSLSQVSTRLAGMAAQRKALENERSHRLSALARDRALLERGLAQSSDLTAAEIALARLDGQLAVLATQQAETRAAIALLEGEHAVALNSEAEKASLELSEIARAKREQSSRIAILKRRREALVVRSPILGHVLSLAVNGDGDVVSPGQPLAEITPDGAGLVARLRVPARHGNALHQAQAVRLGVRLPEEAEPIELAGQVSMISPEALSEPGSAPFFEVRVALDEDIPLDLRPGLPVEGFLRTEGRSLTAILLKPAAEILRRALRES